MTSTSGNNASLMDGLTHFDLAREIVDSEQKRPWASGLYSKTLVKTEDFRVVLIAMDGAAKMNEHHADGTISIQLLKGHIRVGMQGQMQDLRTGSLLALKRSMKHDVESLEDSAFLLTIAWPSNEELLAMEHRGYGK
ncbi:MAG TPA: hypothetical protein VFA74_17595 [Terriglobales bacterium]|nr:hypothetical protein [Terriglobales bacterium]